MANDVSIKHLNSLQEELLELLKRVHTLCGKAGIHYSVYAGTQLGAVREKGFIPWDNDADIAIRRAEYQKLTAYIKQKGLGADMIFDDTIDRIPKFVICRRGRPSAFVDIFIYDYISENPFTQKLKIYLVLILAAITKSKEMIKVTKVNKQLTGLKYVLFYLVYLLGSPFPQQTKIKLWHWFCETKLVGKKTTVFCSNAQEWQIRIDIHKDKVLQSYEEIPFEDTMLMSFKSYDELLRCLYGNDYMTPKRHADTKFDAHEAARLVIENRWEKQKES